MGQLQQQVTAADLDGDGKPDLIAANSDGNSVSVLMNPGNGTFTGAVDYPGPSFVNVIVAADLNGDGLLDVVAANTNESTVSVLLNICPL